jgi:hypothetical protein
MMKERERERERGREGGRKSKQITNHKLKKEKSLQALWTLRE